jgi:hypothetical protein
MLSRLRRAWTSAPPVPQAAGEGAACPNCGVAVLGPYCPQCGQETTIALPSARTFLRDAAGRYVALDGRTWRTLFGLFFRPGFLTREYLAGRRRRYLRPGRLFLVLALAMFAVFRLVGNVPGIISEKGDGASGEPGLVIGAADPSRAKIRVDIKGDRAAKDAAARSPKAGADAGIESPQPAGTDGAAGANGAATAKGAASKPDDDDFKVSVDDLDAPFLQPLRKRLEAFNRQSQEQKTEQIYNGTLRYGPYALVAMLPVFALLMQLAYLGRSRRYPTRPNRYAAHLVFGAHTHAFLFLAVLAFAAVPLAPVRAALALWIVIYLLVSMKNVYRGGWIGVVLRAIVIAFFYLVVFAFAMAGLVGVAIAIR